MNELFFALLRVAIGTQDSLPHIPSKEEWMELYAMAKKQSLVGIVFAAIQRIANDNHDDDDNNHSASGMASEELEPCEVMAKYWNMPEMLYLKWMGMAAKIQQRNEVVNKQCVELQKKLADDGLKSCVMKGQGVAALYKQHENEYENENIHLEASLSMLRQSGDIDIYVTCGREHAIRYAQSLQKEVDWDYKHLHLDIFPGTEVEMHYRTEMMFNVFKNRTLCKWEESDAIKRAVFSEDKNGIITASAEFNLVYLLLHMYNHAMSEGCGLRQFMDYYFLLKSIDINEYKEAALKTIKSLGMKRFAGGVMWVLQEIFGLEKNQMLLSVNEKAGRYLLKDALEGGNFGKYDNSRHWGKALYPIRLIYDWFTRDMRILWNVSSEAM